MSAKASAKPGELPPLAYKTPMLPVGEVIERFDAWAWVEWDEAVAALNGEPHPYERPVGNVGARLAAAERDILKGKQ